MLVLISSTFTVFASTNVEKINVVDKINGDKKIGNTLITDIYGYRVIEVDSDGLIVWQKTGLNGPFDAERLPNGNTLIAELYTNRVIEVDRDGNIVWSYSSLSGPTDVEFLSNGNILICETYANRVLEVDSDGFIVWQKTGLNMPVDAERLENGHTLITEVDNNRVIEVDSIGTILWEKIGLNDPLDAERLNNGNTLISDSDNYRIIEVTSAGNIVWQYESDAMLIDAERFSNGNTLLTEAFYGNRIIEIDGIGTIVWQFAGLAYPVDVERLSNPPDSPKIVGPNTGKPDKEYDYTFNSVDPNGDDVKYLIDWGDNNIEETDYQSSGSDVLLKHSWDEEGNYTIKAKAIDIFGSESSWGSLEISIPKNRALNYKFYLLDWFFKRSQNAFPLIRHLLGF
jgi:hypothetical protein